MTAGGPPEFAGVGGAVDRMRLRLDENRRAEVEEAELRESERVAADLSDGAVRRLFAIRTALIALTALGKRHPALAGELAQPIGELDRAIGAVRAAATGVVPADPLPGRRWRDRSPTCSAAYPGSSGSTRTCGSTRRRRGRYRWRRPTAW